MINEYLFLSDEYRAVVEGYTPSDVIVEISSIENTQLWVAAFSVEGKNEDGAKNCLMYITPWQNTPHWYCHAKALSTIIECCFL